MKENESEVSNLEKEKINKAKMEKLLKERFMSLTDLSKETGLTYTAVRYIFNGITAPKPNNLKKICSALNCNRSDLI